MKIFLAKPKRMGFAARMSDTTATLRFHSISAKSAFIARNGIAPEEIISETPASITMENADDFANSVFVYQVSREA
jgi:hypothetical protein